MTYILKEIEFDQIPLPDTVYKYRTWSDKNHKKILTKNEIHFDSPYNSAGNVRDELIYTWDFDSVSYSELLMWYYTEAYDRGIFGNTNRREYAEENIRFYGSLWTIPGRFEFETNEKRRLNNRVSIFCVSKKKDNPRLWIDFADDQKGICVGFDSKKLFKDKEKFGFGGLVNYCKDDEIPCIHPFSYNFKERILSYRTRIMTLPFKFHDETEYRLAKIDLNEKTFLVPSDCYSEIILGKDMSDEDQEEITLIGKSQFKNTKLFKAVYNGKLNSYEYKQL